MIAMYISYDFQRVFAGRIVNYLFIIVINFSYDTYIIYNNLRFF